MGFYESKAGSGGGSIGAKGTGVEIEINNNTRQNTGNLTTKEFIQKSIDSGKERLKEGETAFARLTPTWLNKEGEIVIAKSENGAYRYLVGWDKNEYHIDKSSNEYKRAVQSNNIKAQFNADGSVTVTKSGLFTKKRTFKDTKAFYNEAKSRLDKKEKYYENEAKLTKEGYISQLAAENYKSLIRNDANALKIIGKDLKDDFHNARTRARAAADMKERLINMVNEADGRLKKRK